MSLPSQSNTQAFKPGTLAGGGSFRCEVCGFAVALQELDQVPVCPHCGGRRFKRSSIFGDHVDAEPWSGPVPKHPDWLEEAREALVADGDYIAWHDDERVRVIALQDGWTRVGRSTAAHVLLDDPTVSRRHALIHRQEDGVRILDDRSLNGLFVNGERLEWHALEDGDEIAVGRFRLYFLRLSASPKAPAGDRAQTTVG